MRGESLLLGNWMGFARVIAMVNLFVYWTADFSPLEINGLRTKV